MIVVENGLGSLVQAGLATRADGGQVSVDITSVTLHVGDRLLRYKEVKTAKLLPSALATESVMPNRDGMIEFRPGDCFLACSLERIRMPLDHMGFIQTKGTIARGFVTVHLCDGQVDPGFDGCVTLEMVNFSQIPYLLRPGTPIAQLFVYRLSERLTQGYAGRYQFADEPTAMRMERGKSEGEI